MTRHVYRARLMLLAACLVCSVVVAGGASGQPLLAADRQEDEPAPVAGLPVYTPPLRGAPAVRVGAGTRGSKEQSVMLQVLAPDHPGLTLSARPVFYWYVENPEAARLQFTLIDANAMAPLLEINPEGAAKQGIQRLDPGDYAVDLEPGVTHQWSVALVRDAAHRSLDVVSSAVIERRMPDDALNQRIEAGHGAERVSRLAGEGIWYDALDTLSGLIEGAPQDRQLLVMRAALLEQAGLAVPGEGRSR
jgi:hypothetical protein